MKLTTYTYNPQTCRYEPSKISFARVAGLMVLFCLVTTLFTIGILYTHSEIFVTEKAKALRKENAALKKHYSLLKRDLTAIEASLTDLEQQEGVLHKRIFNTESASVEVTPTHEQENILLADASGFRSILELLKAKSQTLTLTSDQSSMIFSTIDVSDRDLKFLSALPSIQPIDNPLLDKLVSGFGVRMNPYHKGNYFHPGTDFAAPRGTPVVATGNGYVSKVVNGSTLQAGYGNYIEIDHGQGLITRYAHLEEVKVKYGQRIQKGYLIGTVGMSGGAVAPHLHYEILRDGNSVNPVDYMMEGLSSSAFAELQKRGNKINQALD